MMYLPVWVDDNYCGGCPNDGHAWGTDAFATILDGTNAIAESGTVYVPVGTYNEQLNISKSLSIVGESKGSVTTDSSSFASG